MQRQETGSLGASQKLLSQSLRKVTLSNPGGAHGQAGGQVVGDWKMPPPLVLTALCIHILQMDWSTMGTR